VFSRYKKAVKYPGRIIITGPYIDASVGEIVTISHAMYLSGDKLFAVMGMDVTIDFIYKILRDALPTCKQVSIYPEYPEYSYLIDWTTLFII
jgi:hypothetical protein